MTSTLHHWFVLLLALICLTLLACDELPSTAIELSIKSELEAETELSAIRLSVYDRSGEELLQEREIQLAQRPSKDRYALPVSLSLAAASQSSQRVLRIVVQGMLRSKVVVERSTVVAFRPNAVTPVEIFLARTCVGATCAPDQSCSPETGDCEALPETPPDAAPDVAEDEGGVTPEGGTAPVDAGFDAELDATALPPQDGGRADASLTLPDGGAVDGSTLACAPRNVDLLVVVDNSRTMPTAQDALAKQLPALLRALSYGNRSGTAGVAPEFAPVQSLRIGFVSTDMGVNGAPAQAGCGEKSYPPAARTPMTFVVRPQGDDAKSLTSINVAYDGYWVSMPGSAAAEAMQIVPGEPTCNGIGLSADKPFVELLPGTSSVDFAARQVSCIAKVGINGCGFEQQLEAMLKALTPADSSLLFASNTRGQGDSRTPAIPAGANRGFLRDDALLAVLMMTDEDDCSIPDASKAMFDATATTFSDSVNTRCGLEKNQSYLQPAEERYAAGLRALKAMAKDRVIFAALTGIPTAGATGFRVHKGSSVNTLLARSDMQITTRRNAPQTDDEIVPVCTGTRASAKPARRILQVARSFGDDALIGSICDDDYAGISDALVDRIVAKLSCAR